MKHRLKIGDRDKWSACYVYEVEENGQDKTVTPAAMGKVIEHQEASGIEIRLIHIPASGRVFLHLPLRLNKLTL
jgi:hypothetical protein